MLLELDQEDRIIKRRLAQKITFLKQETIPDDPSQVELENFYVKSSTDTYVETKPLDQIWYGEKYTNYYTFDLEKGKITDNIVSRGETRNYQCKKFK